MNEVASENLLLLGKVIRPHGLTGLLRIKSYAQSEDSFLNPEIIYLKTTSGETHEHRIESLKPHKTIFLMKLKEVNSIKEAEYYKGSEILIGKDFLSPKSEGEYFFYELIGLEVYLDRGEYIGTIKDVISTRSNDVYVVREGKREVLIPAIQEVVQEIDLTTGKMIISEMEGLLD